MWANRILTVGLLIAGPVVFPFQVVSLLVLKILVSMTLGLLLVPIYLIWNMFFLGPLLGLSWIWGKVFFLRVPLAVVGIPLAMIAETYCCLTIGDSYVRIPKLCLCRSWPYTFDCFCTMRRGYPPENARIEAILYDIFKNDVYCRTYLTHIGVWDHEDFA